MPVDNAPVWEAVDRAQALEEGADGPAPPARPACPRCGHVGERRATYYGAYVLFEDAETYPAHLVPVGHRWYADPGGRVWNGGTDEPVPKARSFVAHRLRCPALALVEPATRGAGQG
ncbi:DUF6083 domain-containing protein [Streptomyces sp. NPDC053431]|uniref:DUF6083 domain-containing protein n=1 Tax=Streptomyces sp. NPDC053431 TaxID=3365703 RepID=UPI0037CE517E